MDKLPAPLQPLAAYPQFVTWRLVPSARVGKKDKLPCDWRTGAIANAHNPATWGTFEQCADAVQGGRGQGIGFVFTADDPFWFLDIDRAWNGKEWSPVAIDLCDRFAGAAVEVSQSGTGLHIIGTGKVPPHACKDTALGLELYHEKRFVALTGTFAVGDAASDHSAALARLVEETFLPISQSTVSPDEWTDEPVERAEPPATDDDLIRRALESGNRSAEAAFGNAVTFRDLWEGNDDALATRWPSQTGDAYDRSSADAALATRLAFWTGKNCERIRALMHQSALVREKWERDDYLPRTIVRACGVSGDVVRGQGTMLEETTLPATMANSSPLQATAYAWPDATKLPTRQWLMGHWFLRGEVTTVIAPGGSGKSTILHAVALSLASGRPLLGKSLPRGPVGVWVFNLEDGTDELQRQVAAACAHHSINREMCGGRLFLDSGLCQPLRTAIENRDGFELREMVFGQVTATVRMNSIGALIVDPFVSSHGVHESSNEAIDAIAKRWKRLAQETGCAVVLVHHTRKLGGREATAEDGRGAVALRDAARVVLTLNPMNEREAENLGIANPQLRRSLVRIDVGKANRAPPDEATWICLSSQSLANGSDSEPPDLVGVATLWEKPDLLCGVLDEHLRKVKERLLTEDWRDNAQAKDWVGYLIAEVTGLSPQGDKPRIKAIYKKWKSEGWLSIARRVDKNGDERPFVSPGKMAVEINGHSSPHLPTCGAEGAESAAGNPT